VNGSVVAFVADVVAGVVLVGVVLVVVGAAALFGLLLSFDGSVPVEGFGVVVAGVVVAGVVVAGVVEAGGVVVVVVVVGGVWP